MNNDYWLSQDLFEEKSLQGTLSRAVQKNRATTDNLSWIDPNRWTINGGINLIDSI